MTVFSNERGAFTPATNQDNWTLEADTQGDVAKVLAIWWGGRMTASTGYRTRWTRPTTAGTSTFTALTKASHTPNYNTPLCRIGTFATAPVLDTDPAGNLFAIDWNAQGGAGYVVLPPSAPWWIFQNILQSQISCRNIAGTDANSSNYGVSWEE